MKTTSDRIKEGMELLGLKQVDLVEKTGISKGALSSYLSGKYLPKQNNIYRIAKALNVNEAWLMGHDVPKERTDINNTSIFDLADNIIPFKTKKIPLLGEIACGEPIYATEEFGNYVTCLTNINADFCLVAKGDSMINARIYDGDIVFIKEQPDVYDGEIAAVIIDDEATLKRVYKDRLSLTLQAENPKYRPIIITENDCKNVRILGKAVAFQSNIR